jgi:hypothetical protein
LSAVCQALDFIGCVLRHELGVQPVGQIEANRRRQFVDLHRLGLRQPFALGFAQHALQLAPVHSLQAGQGGEQQPPRAQFTGTTRRQRALATQHREHRFGDETAVGMAEFAMLAKIVGNDQVGWKSRAQQFRQQCFGVTKEGGSKTRGACGHCGSWLISMAVATCT